MNSLKRASEMSTIFESRKSIQMNKKAKALFVLIPYWELTDPSIYSARPIFTAWYPQLCDSIRNEFIINSSLFTFFTNFLIHYIKLIFLSLLVTIPLHQMPLFYNRRYQRLFWSLRRLILGQTFFRPRRPVRIEPSEICLLREMPAIKWQNKVFQFFYFFLNCCHGSLNNKENQFSVVLYSFIVPV